MSKRKPQQWFVTALCGLLFAGLGCQSTPETVEEPERPQRTRTEAMPSPEELGDQPCGNPNWAKLPPGVGEVNSAESVEPVEEEEPEADDPDEEAPIEKSEDE